MTSNSFLRRPDTVPAAGAVLWRRKAGQLRVALVHRPKYDDWSWAKGKLDPGETWAGAAAREVLEETGFRPRLGIPLPRSVYSMQRGQLKEIRYWAASIMGGTGELVNEIDQLAWLTPAQAQGRFSYVRDALQLNAVVDADARGWLDTRPFVIVRHGEALARKEWRGEDADRPLNDAGRQHAKALVPILAAYGIERIITSPSARCFTTVQPYAAAAGLTLRPRKGLSEEGFAETPDKAARHTVKALQHPQVTALCTHRPVLPAVLDTVRRFTAPDAPAAAVLEQVSSAGLDKGEALVCQIAGNGDEPQVVSIERHRPAESLIGSS